MSINKELLKGSMKTVVLQMLKRKTMHGYELLATIKDMSGGKLEVTEGTLYPLLHSLEQDGFVEAVWEKGAGQRKRRVYEITKQGRKLLKDRTQELNEFMAVMGALIARRDVVAI